MDNLIKRWWDGVQDSAEIKTEFILWQGEIVKLMRGTKAMPKMQRRAEFKRLLDRLSEDALQKNIKTLMNFVQRHKIQCEPFNNTEEQVNDIMIWLPRLRNHQVVISNIVKKRRNKYKLPI